MTDINITGCVYNVNYHFVLFPKYRKPVLTVRVADDLKNLVKKKPANHET